MRIVLVSSGQPSVNPRLVKEANKLSSEGYDVYVIYAYWEKWAFITDIELFKTVKWKPILAGGSPNNDKLIYYFSKIRNKIAKFISKNITFKLGFAELTKFSAFVDMLKKAKNIKADLYIAHNLAALPIAAKAAKYHNSKYSFDAEDFHRQENTDDTLSLEFSISKFIEDKYFKNASFITAASPLIGEEYKKNYQDLHFHVINNVFESKFIQEKQIEKSAELKLFWFSQTIGKNRGLEDIIQALIYLNNAKITLHLLGNLTEVSKNYFDNLVKNSNVIVQYYKPILPEKIFEFASQFDIGLALEKTVPYNRNICLTNKIFTYLTSGLAVIASDTLSQKQFMLENEDIGKCIEQSNVIKLAELINHLYIDNDFLHNCKSKSRNLAISKYNWEIESEIFIELVKNSIT